MSKYFSEDKIRYLKREVADYIKHSYRFIAQVTSLIDLSNPYYNFMFKKGFSDEDILQSAVYRISSKISDSRVAETNNNFLKFEQPEFIVYYTLEDKEVINAFLKDKDVLKVLEHDFQKMYLDDLWNKIRNYLIEKYLKSDEFKKHIEKYMDPQNKYHKPLLSITSSRYLYRKTSDSPLEKSLKAAADEIKTSLTNINSYDNCFLKGDTINFKYPSYKISVRYELSNNEVMYADMPEDTVKRLLFLYTYENDSNSIIKDKAIEYLLKNLQFINRTKAYLPTKNLNDSEKDNLINCTKRYLKEILNRKGRMTADGEYLRIKVNDTNIYFTKDKNDITGYKITQEDLEKLILLIMIKMYIETNDVIKKETQRLCPLKGRCFGGLSYFIDSKIIKRQDAFDKLKKLISDIVNIQDFFNNDVSYGKDFITISNSYLRDTKIYYKIEDSIIIHLKIDFREIETVARKIFKANMFRKIRDDIEGFAYNNRVLNPEQEKICKKFYTTKDKKFYQKDFEVFLDDFGSTLFGLGTKYFVDTKRDTITLFGKKFSNIDIRYKYENYKIKSVELLETEDIRRFLKYKVNSHKAYYFKSKILNFFKDNSYFDKKGFFEKCYRDEYMLIVYNRESLKECENLMYDRIRLYEDSILNGSIDEKECSIKIRIDDYLETKVYYYYRNGKILNAFIEDLERKLSKREKHLRALYGAPEGDEDLSYLSVASKDGNIFKSFINDKPYHHCVWTCSDCDPVF